ncbi:MAG TPA: hypothetical protein VER58_00570 [Thermoanaerobaculia bacterium]|nr:hypothetical protein [Thermoanaerobaculia bacterium]
MVRQHAGAAALFLLLAILMTWPLTRNLNRAVAYPGDPYINTWILDWDWYATFHRPLHLFDANAFYPARYSLAYSENLYGIALLLFPFRAAGSGPITAHNIAVLLGFAFCGYGAYALGRLMTGSGPAGIVAGIFYEFVPYRFTHLPHVQHIWAGTLPILLAALLWYAQKPTWQRAALFGAAFLFNGLCNIHWLLFGSVAVAATIVIVRPRLLPLTVCTAFAILLLAVFLQPYREAADIFGMRWSWSETRLFSAMPSDWLISNFHNRLYAPLRNPSVDPERWLFPGALSLILGALAFMSRNRKPLQIAGLWIGIGFFGSLGLHTVFHRFLFRYVPVFQAVRVPARWAAIALVGLAILVAIGTALIARGRTWVSVIVALAFLAELRSAPVLWYIAPTEIPPVEQWIAQERPHAIVELPIVPGLEHGAMLRATSHHVPMVNGISGFAPPQYARLATLAQEWSEGLFPELQRIGVSHVVVHADAIDAAGRASLARAITQNQIAFRRRFDAGILGDWLFEIGGQSVRSPDLDAMLLGMPTRAEGTFGAFFSPPPGARVTSQTVMSGFAFSPFGIRSVTLLVNNGAIRLPTRLDSDPQLQREFQWYPQTTKPKFTAQFRERPPGVWTHTDIQPEIIDGRGNRVLLEDRWVEWP